MKYDWKYFGFEISPSVKPSKKTLSIRFWKIRITLDISLVKIDLL